MLHHHHFTKRRQVLDHGIRGLVYHQLHLYTQDSSLQKELQRYLHDELPLVKVVFPCTLAKDDFMVMSQKEGFYLGFLSQVLSLKTILSLSQA